MANEVRVIVPDDMGMTIKLGIKEAGKYDIDPSALDLDIPEFDSSLKPNEQGKLTVFGERAHIKLDNNAQELPALHVRDRIYVVERGLLQVGDSDIYLPFYQSMDFSKVYLGTHTNFFTDDFSQAGGGVLPLGEYFDGKETATLSVTDRNTWSKYEVTVSLRDGQLVIDGGNLPDLDTRLAIDGNIIYATQGDVSIGSQGAHPAVSFSTPEAARHAFHRD